MATEDFRRVRWRDDDREAVSWLLEHFWIKRSEYPEIYHRIHDRQRMLRHFFQEKCGFQLVVKPGFAKLEKIPDQAEPWMGIKDFQKPRDYVIFCCLLSFLDEKDVDEQFLLSDLITGIKNRYPSRLDADPEATAAPINWQYFQHRKSLVRVMKFAVVQGLVLEVDGKSDIFGSDMNSEVLYEVTVFSRYFTISYPKDLFSFQHIDDILEASRQAETETELRRHRVYRRLLLTPAYHRESDENGDFVYLRNQRNRLRDDFSERTPFHLELTKNTAILTLQEVRAHQNIFPSRLGIDDVILHFARHVRERLEDQNLTPAGEWEMTTLEFSQLLEQVRKADSPGWSSEYRDKGIRPLTEALLQELINWRMASLDKQAGLIRLKPLLGRLVGRYPKSFNPTPKRTTE